jgi:chromosome segregation ATPase
LATTLAQIEAQEARQGERTQEFVQIDQDLAELEIKIREATQASSTTELEQKKFGIVEQLQQFKTSKVALDSEWVEKRIAFGALQERLERLDQRSLSVEMTQSEYTHNRDIYKSDIDLWTNEISAESARLEQLSAQKSQDELKTKEIERRLAESKQSLNSIRSQIEQAEVALQVAQKLSAVANKLDRTSTGLRTYWEAEITDRRDALNHYIKREPEAFLDLIQTLADRDARSTRAPVPGVIFHERKRAA